MSTRNELFADLETRLAARIHGLDVQEIPWGEQTVEQRAAETAAVVFKWASDHGIAVGDDA